MTDRHSIAEGRPFNSRVDALATSMHNKSIIQTFFWSTTMAAPLLNQPDRIVSRTRTVVDHVYELLLAAIVEGDLVAGEALHDMEWAERLNVSRTPIREAIKRLEGHGIIDIAAARYTRIASFTPETARQEAQGWAMVHLALTRALCGVTDQALVADLRRLRNRARSVGATREVAASFAFFTRLRVGADLFSVRLATTAAAYRLRLAQPQLPAFGDANRALHTDLITALQRNTPGTLPAAFEAWTEAATRA
ncbi:GntR family transcriptional regulator [Agromyces aerolatus]|uniref:GntR family transcriptional regulator n=1 Tax=Agromyces sp. LY-1074 TaxID=3074080 RepID=UPI002857DA32|nr:MULTISPECIES: GntR family transcriptional regulator [unclassified Agromyces]MDR5699768.1 GntR family transcriptional regulator [Agromyces sp. LY-1074]MDR5706064.1 GntR family transcriptional regulator [Agromyces sp. LY-1358]